MVNLGWLIDLETSKFYKDSFVLHSCEREADSHPFCDKLFSPTDMMPLDSRGFDGVCREM